MLTRAVTDIDGALSSATIANYRKALSEFQEFLIPTFQIKWEKAQMTHFIAYTAFLYHHMHNSASSIKTKLSGISYFYKTRFGYNPVKSEAVGKMLQNYSKCQSSDSRKPLKANLVEKLLKIHNSTPNYYNHAFYILYVLMYRMALRVSEVANYSKKFEHAIRLTDIKVFEKKQQITVRLKSYKHSTQQKIYNISVTRNFIKHINNYRKARKSIHSQFFVHTDGSPFTRNFIAQNLKSDLITLGINPNRYNTHSLRIGRASDLAEQGCSDSKIAEIGRWRSNAFTKYIRNQVTQV